MGEIGTAPVRSWRTTLLDSGMSVNRAAKVYRLLRAILGTAVDDGMLKRTPCRIKGADREQESSRPVASVPQVYALADAAPAHFRALILLGGFTSLRWSELVDLHAGLVHVVHTLSERDGGELDHDNTTKCRPVSGPSRYPS